MQSMNIHNWVDNLNIKGSFQIISMGVFRFFWGDSLIFDQNWGDADKILSYWGITFCFPRFGGWGGVISPEHFCECGAHWFDFFAHFKQIYFYLMLI